nr:class D sortase [Pullulanibacillus pueri]
MRKLAFLIILVGLGFAGVGGWQLWHGSVKQHETMKKAQALTVTKKDPVKYKDWDPIKGETIGILYIPRLDKKLGIVEGTSPDQLEKGVGHYKSSALPGKNDQVVLSGHRDTVFRHFGEIQKGDDISVDLPYGTYTYVVDHMKIVDKDDRTIIHSTKPKEELVLTTCYPFSYIGDAPKRYIIYAYPKKK